MTLKPLGKGAGHMAQLFHAWDALTEDLSSVPSSLVSASAPGDLILSSDLFRPPGMHVVQTYISTKHTHACKINKSLLNWRKGGRMGGKAVDELPPWVTSTPQHSSAAVGYLALIALTTYQDGTWRKRRQPLLTINPNTNSLLPGCERMPQKPRELQVQRVQQYCNNSHGYKAY